MSNVRMISRSEAGRAKDPVQRRVDATTAPIVEVRDGTEATTRTRGPRVIEGDIGALELALADEVRGLKQSDALAPISVLVGGTLSRPYLGRRLADLTGGHINVRFLTAGDFG